MIKYPQKADLQDAKKDSIDTLQHLYSIVLALALTRAMIEIKGQWGSTESRLTVVALSVAFLSTLVPFYHGMNRHLYETHVRNSETGEHGRPIPLLIDIFVFIVESGLLFAMGQQLNNPTTFMKFWLALLTIDILWTIIVWGFQRGEKPRWGLNNAGWVSIVFIAYLVYPMFPSSWSGLASYGVYMLAIVEVCRSIIDYYLNWKYYFPWAPLSVRRISGRVVDQRDSPITNASVRLIDSGGNTLGDVTSVNYSGEFRIPNRFSGRCRLVVEAPEFCSASGELRIAGWPSGGMFHKRNLVIHMEATSEDGHSHIDYK